jgi:putative nucleotidyltransferase with HDIG domain
VELLTPGGVEQLVHQARVFDFFGSAPGWAHAPEQFRIHAVAVQRAADHLSRELEYPRRDELLAAAVLHDIGKLVLVHAYSIYPGEVHGDARTPEERLKREQRALGVDHATVGGVLARRGGLPKGLASAIENHHSDEAVGDAAFLRVADMLAHYGHGDPVDPGCLSSAARAIGLAPERLRALMFTLPNAGARKRSIDPSPLTPREGEMLKLLAKGKSCKQIAFELDRSPSTVRSHLHNSYEKLGALDRSQAVLIATDQGWI